MQMICYTSAAYGRQREISPPRSTSRQPARTNRPGDHRSAGRLWNWPVLAWVVLAYLITYVIFFISPIFLNPEHSMAFPQYVPSREPVGLDLYDIRSLHISWLIEHKIPYYRVALPRPWQAFFSSPLLLVEYPVAYKIATLVNVLCYIAATLLIPCWFTSRKIPWP